MVPVVLNGIDYKILIIVKVINNVYASSILLSFADNSYQIFCENNYSVSV